MIFSRKAKMEDFNSENERWEKILHKDVRDAVNKNRNIRQYLGLMEYRKRFYCGVEEGKQVIGRYISFLDAWEDYANNKEVYVQY